MKDFYKRKNCRLCNCKDLKLVLPLKKSPLCDAYSKVPKSTKKYPLDLYQCNNCGFVQISVVIKPEIIYKNYIYVTTSSMGLSKHFLGYAKWCLAKFKFRKNSLVIDIGSNDGTLLNCFKKQGFKTIGVEPAKNVASQACNLGIKTIPKFFNLKTAKEIRDKFGYAKIITINNLFANIDDLDSLIIAIDKVLAPDGVLVIESSYLYKMIENMVFDFIYHEHLSYFSIYPLIKFFKKYNYHLIDITNVKTKGGSMRYCWARQSSIHEVSRSVSSYKFQEKNKYLNKCLFKKFHRNIHKNKLKLSKILANAGRSKIIGFGASATSTTLISHFDLNKTFDCLVDENPAKVDTYSPGFNIPVVSVNQLMLKRPDIIIILAWRYSKNILKKLKSWNLKCKVIVPLPTLKKHILN